MRKFLVAAAVVAGFTFQSAVAAGQFDYQPRGVAFVTMNFGGGQKTIAAPLRYGFAFDYQRIYAHPWSAGSNSFVFDSSRAPLLAMQIDSKGNSLAAVNGIPFVQHIAADYQAGGGGGSQVGGLTMVDWSLLVVGLGGVGYLISQAATGSSSPDPATPTKAGSTSTLSNGLFSGFESLPTMRLNTLSALGLQTREQPWLQYDNGQMGDLLATH